MLTEGFLPMAPQFTGNILCGVVAGLQKNTISMLRNTSQWQIEQNTYQTSHHLTQLDNTSASILVTSNSLGNCCLGPLLYLFLHLV